MDIENMSKEQLIEYIKNMNESQTGKFGLVWDKEKEPEKIVTECSKYIPVLKEIKEKNITNGGQNNILIEGDNFHALSVLNYTHKEKVNIIYIDPPYNTGNNDFIYNDKFINNDDGYKHSKWLNFMQKRLKLAHELLTEDGVIYISIDDNEQAQLKLLCDSIFNSDNFLGMIIQNKGNAQNDAIDIQKNHEYILVYRKRKRVEDKKVIPTIIYKDIKDKDIFKDEHGYYYKNGGITTGGEGGTLSHRLNLGYTIYYNPITNDAIALEDYDKELAKISNDEKKVYKDCKELLDKGYVKIRPPKKGNVLGVWTWGIDKFNKEKYKLYFSKYRNSYSVIKKEYIDENKVIKIDGKLKYQEEFEKATKSIVNFSTSEGTKVLAKVMGANKMFNNPKNHEMIKYLIGLYQNKDAIILDFFAGSGTTAQSVMELNNEDGGKRQVIVCTNNENNICEEVTYPRISNIIKGYDNNQDLQSSLKYYRTSFVATENSTKDQLYYDLTEKCIPMLCVKENTFDEVEKNEEYEIYKNNKNKFTCVYFDFFGQRYNEFKDKIRHIKEEKSLYIFTLGTNINIDELEGVINYKVEPIPQKIYDLYRKIVRMSKEG